METPKSGTSLISQDDPSFWTLDVSWLLQFPDTRVESSRSINFVNVIRQKWDALLHSNIALSQDIREVNLGIDWEGPARVIVNSGTAEHVQKFYKVQLLRKMLRTHWRRQIRGFSWPFDDEVDENDFRKVHEIISFTEADFLEARKLAADDIRTNPTVRYNMVNISL